MKGTFDRLLGVILPLSALLIAGSVVYRTFVPRFVRGPTIEYVDGWERGLDWGIPIGGPDSAAATIMVFDDLECPSCRGFHRVLKGLLTEMPTQVRAIYMSYPLPYHRFAMPAARAAECAHQHGFLTEWLNIVFEKQDSLGLKSWGSFAADVGMQGTTAIASCAVDRSSNPRITAAADFADAIGVDGTPTVILNGWRFSSPPSDAVLRDAVESILAGRTPKP